MIRPKPEDFAMLKWVVYIPPHAQKQGLRIGDPGKLIRPADDPNFVFVKYQKTAQTVLTAKKDLFWGDVIRKCVSEDLPLPKDEYPN